jgi:hypothetical protein
MATPIKRIEKEFLLKALYDGRIPVMCVNSRAQHMLTVEKIARGQMVLRCDHPVIGLRAYRFLDLMFDYHGKTTMFSAEVNSVSGNHVITGEPEFLYRDLARSFSRVPAPPDLRAQFTFLGDRYSLSYPSVAEYESVDSVELMTSMDLRNLKGIINQIESWIKTFASGQKVVIFKNAESSLHFIEEKILAETGKALLLPSTQGSYPAKDPYPQKRIITEELFKRYLEGIGVDRAYVDKAYTRFISNKLEQGICSDLWVPIRFHQYVVGYIHSWISENGKAPVDYGTLDNLCQFSRILVRSFKANGYFESGKVKNEPFDARIANISASGLLFTHPHSTLVSPPAPDSELAVMLKAPARIVKAKARIVRQYRDNIHGYFGCRFLDMEPEDINFLFEHIYGKPFTGQNTTFLSGQV